MGDLLSFVKKHKRIYCYGLGKCLRDLFRFLEDINHRIAITGYFVSERCCSKQKNVEIFSRAAIDSAMGIIISVYNLEYIETIKKKIGDDFKDHTFVLVEDEQYKKWLYKRFISVCKSRKKLNVFDYKRLASDIDYYFSSPNENWSFLSYGISRYIKKRVHIPWYDVKKCSIIHGINVSSDKIFSPVDLNPIDGNVFTANVRQLDGYNGSLNIYALKPYITYARSLFSRGKIRTIKRQLGKTLLVMPSHSVKNVDTIYNRDAFSEEIECIKRKYEYKTVLVCLHFADIQKGEDEYYKKLGYKIVTAGHVNDIYFLSRLKAIFLLSDTVIGNDYGTFLPYAISLNRPVYIFQQKIVYNGLKEDNEVYMNKKMKSDAYEKIMNEAMQEQQDIISHFSYYTEDITESQYSVMKKLCTSWITMNTRK